MTGTPPSDLAAPRRKSVAPPTAPTYRPAAVSELTCSGQVDLGGRVDRDEPVLGGENCRVVGVAGVAQLDRAVSGGERDECPAAHQEAGDHDAGVDALAGTGHDARCDQLGDCVGDDARVDAQVAVAAQPAGDRGRDAADAELDRGAVRDQSGDVRGDCVLDTAGRSHRVFGGGRETCTSTSISSLVHPAICAHVRHLIVDLRDDGPGPPDQGGGIVGAEAKPEACRPVPAGGSERNSTSARSGPSPRIRGSSE